MGPINIHQDILIIAVLILSITLHEFAHAITADRLGDPTPRAQGRISILPIDHLDPFGTIMMIITTISGFGLGWGKPVQTNPRNFRHPRRDQGIVAVAGPISNLIQATICAIPLRTGLGGHYLNGTLGQFLIYGVMINLSLAFFNLIPISPLDGHWIVTAILPYEQAIQYFRFMSTYGMIILILLVVVFPSVLAGIIIPPVTFFGHLLVGHSVY